MKFGLLLFLNFAVTLSFSQTATVRGIVKDELDHVLPGVNVVINGTSLGTMSTSTGEFEIENIPAGTHTLIMSMIGLEKHEQSIVLTAGSVKKLPTIILKESHQSMEEIVIVASREAEYVASHSSESLRLPVQLLEIPQNISVATKQSMKDFGIIGTAEMSRMTSGIIKRYGGSNDFAFTIRGTDATNNVFRNGIGGYWWNQQADAFMLDRVEFVKGPAGFMIGNSEPGGLLNEVTKQADGTKTREVMLGYGSWNLMRGGIDLGGYVTNKSKFSFRIVAGGQRTNANYNFYRSYRTYVTPSVRYTYKPGSYVQAELIRMDGHAKADNNNNISFTGDDLLFPIKFNAADPNALNGIETDDTYLRLSNTHKFANGWTLRTQVADVHGIYMGDGMYVSASSKNYDTLYREYWQIRWRNELQAAQTFIDGKFKTGNHIEHSILTGIDYGRTIVRSAWGEYNPDGWGTQLELIVADPVYDLDHDELSSGVEMYPEDDWGTQWLALYAQDHIKFFNKVIVTAAGRLSRTKSWASWDSTTVYNTKFTPRVGLTYLINDNMSLYALFDETFLPQTGRKQDRSLPEPLTGSNIEIGYKSQLAHKRLNLNASLFRTVKNNVLVQNPQTSFYEERGQITSQGFEFDVTGNLTDNIVVNANYTFTDAKVTEDPDQQIVGFRNYGVAKHTGNAMVRYKFNTGKLIGLSLGTGMQLTGAKSAVWAGWTDPTDKDKSSPAYAIFDANIGYDLKHFSAYLNVYNLLNNRYMDSAWWNSGTVDEDNPDNNTNGYYSFAAGQPLNFRITIGYKI